MSIAIRPRSESCCYTFWENGKGFNSSEPVVIFITTRVFQSATGNSPTKLVILQESRGGREIKRGSVEGYPAR